MIPPEVVGPVLAFLGVVAGSVLTFLGVKYTARQSAKAAQTAAQVSARQVDVEEWRAIVGALREEVGRLTERVDRLERGRESDAALIAELRTEASDADARYRALFRYTRDLLEWVDTELPGVAPPRAPDPLAHALGLA
ncbi:hypothetical protein HOU70_gp22 [Arthrobacter phage Liebe]|uniref:Membrane protein n=2 Tax=Arthrobacter virus Liebe TaxID=2734245 RepID=A0A3G2KHP8_9CAUD|nr:hypothetical protein HOU70_gp22 [Arthrobacter phage Liebe]AYN58503.1 membrane protein [Arthrobacter phage Maureen]AZF93755.1 membrane protein [Arthrobacter phage Liebe]